MKFIFPIAFSLFAFVPLTLAHADAAPEFKTSCTISLIGLNANSVQETKTSAAAPAAHGPRVSFDLGGAILISYVQSTVSVDSTVSRPELSVELYRKGQGPIAGQINFAGLTYLNSLTVGQKSTAFSRSFLDIKYNGQVFSRIDYSCNIERTK